MVGLKQPDTVTGARLEGVVRRGRQVPGFVIDALLVAFFFIATGLFYWRIVTPDLANRASFPKGDFVEQFYAFAYYRAQELLGGRLPLWNPTTYAGHPFIADIQSAVFYPLSWPTTLIAGKSYPLFALELEAVFHVFLAGAFAYAFGVVAFRNRFAAVVSGLVFAFGGYVTSYPSQQLSILEVQVWLPLILLFAHLATRQVASQRSRLSFTIIGGLTLGVSALAGHPQAFMYVLYGVALYLFFRLFEILLDQGRRSLLSTLWVVPVFIGVGLGLAAIQLVPTYEFMRVSSRAKLAYEFTSWGFPLKDLLQMVLPGSVSLTSPMYVGILPLVLTIMAVQRRLSRAVVFWAAVAVVTFLLSFGGHTFLYSVFYLAVPGFSTFRDHERAIYLTGFAVAQLAGYGALLVADLRFPKAEVTKVARALLLSAVGVLAVLIMTFLLDTISGKLGHLSAIVAFLLLVVFLGFVLLQARGLGLPAPLFTVLVVALIVFDLFSVNWKNNVEAKKPEDHYQSTPLIRYLQENSQKGRVFNEYQMPLNYGAVYGIDDINGASPLIVERFKMLSSLPQERQWQILNVRYLLTWQGGYQGGKKISVEGNMNLYELPDPMPRASVLHDARIETRDESALALLAAAEFDPRTTVVLAEDPGLALPGRGVAPSRATFSTLRPDQLVIETDIEKPGVLLVSEVFYPGWKVRVDGKPSRILRADVALRAVPLEAGKHIVEMTFEPASVKLGAAMTTLTLASSLLALFGAKLWPRKQV